MDDEEGENLMRKALLAAKFCSCCRREENNDNQFGNRRTAASSTNLDARLLEQSMISTMIDNENGFSAKYKVLPNSN